MQRLRTVTSLDVSAVAGHHAMPAALLYSSVVQIIRGKRDNFRDNFPYNSLKTCFDPPLEPSCGEIRKNILELSSVTLLSGALIVSD